VIHSYFSPFFTVLNYIEDVWIESEVEINLDNRFSIHMEDAGLSITHHRIYEGEDSGEVLSFNLAYCGKDEDGPRSAEKYILFSIFKEYMNFTYIKLKEKIKLESWSEKKENKELNIIKTDVNKESEKFLEFINANYPDCFPKEWREFEDFQKAVQEENEKEIAKMQIEDPEAIEQPFSISMKFLI
jgi:hypothetical protein